MAFAHLGLKRTSGSFVWKSDISWGKFNFHKCLWLYHWYTTQRIMLAIWRWWSLHPRTLYIASDPWSWIFRIFSPSPPPRCRTNHLAVELKCPPTKWPWIAGRRWTAVANWLAPPKSIISPGWKWATRGKKLSSVHVITPQHIPYEPPNRIYKFNFWEKVIFLERIPPLVHSCTLGRFTFLHIAIFLVSFQKYRSGFNLFMNDNKIFFVAC